MLAFYLSMLETQEEKDKFEKIYSDYMNLMVGVAMRILHNECDAQDAVQESFIKIMKHLQKINFEACTQTRSFIVTIVRNTCFDMLKKHRRSAQDVEYNDELKENDFPHTETDPIKLLGEELNGLNESYRLPLILKYDCGYSIEEVADILNITVNNAKTRLTRAKTMLREQLEEETKKVAK